MDHTHDAELRANRPCRVLAIFSTILGHGEYDIEPIHANYEHEDVVDRGSHCAKRQRVARNEYTKERNSATFSKQ